MYKGLELIIISVDEPQLDRCIKAIKKQTQPPQKITHFNNVVPESVAHNKALKQLDHEWSIWVGGDFILDPDAIAKFWFWHGVNKNPMVYEFGFGLRDTFVQRTICGCSVCNSEVIQKINFKDVLANDAVASKKLQRKYKIWKLWRKEITVGTHFEDPDEFQVFRRFYARGVKASGKRKKAAMNKTSIELRELYAQTGNQLYELAIAAFDLGFKEKHYPTSHNIEFERKVFEQWKIAN